MLSTANFLSPNSRCHSFDGRADGYGRGEGVVAIVLKPVSAAVRDGDMIRAVIRSTASNQDGQTPILTQPSPQAQEDLIRHVYSQANLPLDQTRYFEAHGMFFAPVQTICTHTSDNRILGTGTPVGDPIETKAIGRVFRKYRSADEPLYMYVLKWGFALSYEFVMITR